jgi:hypothetical protein
MSLEAHYALRKQPLISLVSELIAVIIDHCRTGGKPPVKVVYILIAAAAAMAKSLPRHFRCGAVRSQLSNRRRT